MDFNSSSHQILKVNLWRGFRLPFEMPDGYPFRRLEIACDQTIYSDENLKDPSDTKRRSIVLQVIPFASASNSDGNREASKLRNRWLTENPRCIDTVRYPELNREDHPRLTFRILETDAVSSIPIIPEGDAWLPLRPVSSKDRCNEEMAIIATINRLALIGELIPTESPTVSNVVGLLGRLQNLEYGRVGLGEISQLERDLLFSSDHIQACDVERVKDYFSDLRYTVSLLNPSDKISPDEITTSA